MAGGAGNAAVTHSTCSLRCCEPASPPPEPSPAPQQHHRGHQTHTVKQSPQTASPHCSISPPLATGTLVFIIPQSMAGSDPCSTSRGKGASPPTLLHSTGPHAGSCKVECGNQTSCCLGGCRVMLPPKTTSQPMGSSTCGPRNRRLPHGACQGSQSSRGHCKRGDPAKGGTLQKGGPHLAALLARHRDHSASAHR